VNKSSSKNSIYRRNDDLNLEEPKSLKEELFRERKKNIEL